MRLLARVSEPVLHVCPLCAAGAELVFSPGGWGHMVSAGMLEPSIVVRCGDLAVIEPTWREFKIREVAS